MRTLVGATLLFCWLIVGSCGGGDTPEPEPVPAGTSAPAPSEAAAERSAVAEGDVRLLLFDAQTALEAVYAVSEGYPTTIEFAADDRWAIHRTRLDGAFEEWSYDSDGVAYRLQGSRGGKRFDIVSSER